MAVRTALFWQRMDIMVLLYYSFTVKLQGSLGAPLPQRSQPDGLGVQKQAEGGQGGGFPPSMFI